MVVYSCLRCGYETKFKCSLRDHYNKKNICKPVISNISNEECLNKLYEKRKPICEYCNKEFSTISNMKRHKIDCNEKRFQKLEKEKNELERKIRMGMCHPQEEDSGDTDNFIYLIQEREFIKTHENVYKLGKTVNPKQRLSSYPKGSKVILVLPCTDCNVAESSLLSIFDRVFTKRIDIGSEYYEGNIGSMAKIVMRYVLNEEGESLAFPPGELIDE